MIEVVISHFWKAAKVKGCGELEEWIDPIVNHFWYCCQVADGSGRWKCQRTQGKS